MSPKDIDDLTKRIANGDMNALAQAIGKIGERVNGLQRTIDTVDRRTAKMQSDMNDIKVVQGVDHKQVEQNCKDIRQLSLSFDAWSKDLKDQVRQNLVDVKVQLNRQLEESQKRVVTWAWLVDKFGPPVITGLIVAIIMYLVTL
jgi:hypothetical protein